MQIIKIGFMLLLVTFCSCKKFLDVVPDNVATLDLAFNSEHEAEKFLFTCYSYLPAHGDPTFNPSLISGDEMWFFYPYIMTTGGPGPYSISWNIARGEQNTVNPLMNNFWSGTKNLFQGISTCNIFLENIGRVPGMTSTEKNRWIGEVNFLKAYFNFWLVRMYGPIPIMDKNIPIDASPDKMQIGREPIDSCFNYISRLLDTASVYLPDQVQKPSIEMGRITRPIAMAIKARVLVTAASPLFNGNPDYANYTNKDLTHLFNTTYDKQKWIKAAKACEAAVNLCQQLGYHLYEYEPELSTYFLSDITKRKMSIRNSVASWFNSGIIWANRNSMGDYLQSLDMAIIFRDDAGFTAAWQFGSAPLKIAEMFYTKNGLPINEDKTWDYVNRFELRTADSTSRYNIFDGYETAGLNFDREPRFYADLGFDGGMWYGMGEYNDTLQGHMEAKAGQYSSLSDNVAYNITGYWPKKMVNYQTIINNGLPVVATYPWPVMKLDDLYLLYAEALNEVNGPGPDVYKWINLVRERAGIPTVQDSWTNYSTDPSKYTTKEGIRDIIHRERLIELAFEGQRFWDLKRWKEAETYLNQPIQGWNIKQSSEINYYKLKTLFNQTFRKKDYFWPIADRELNINEKLVQSPGW